MKPKLDINLLFENLDLEIDDAAIAKATISANHSQVQVGKSMSIETRAKISVARKGQKKSQVVSAETRAKLSASLKGKKRSPEHAAAVKAGLLAAAARRRAEKEAIDGLQR